MNGTELIMLGTGNAMVTKCYNTCFALKTGADYLLVDAGGGNGILRQMELAGIPFAQVPAMFVSHGHTDHVLGVIWVVRRISAMIKEGTYPGTFRIFCHAKLAVQIEEICRQLLPDKFTRFFGERILFEQVKEGQEKRAAGLVLRFFDIDSKKKKQFGFQAQLADNKQLAFLGDEPFCTRNRPYVEGSDWLLSEAFCLNAEQTVHRPYEKHHSTALDAGRMAAGLGIKNLVLYHTEDTDLSHRRQRYTAEAKLGFSGAVYVPDDLERIQL